MMMINAVTSHLKDAHGYSFSYILLCSKFFKAVKSSDILVEIMLIFFVSP